MQFYIFKWEHISIFISSSNVWFFYTQVCFLLDTLILLYSTHILTSIISLYFLKLSFWGHPGSMNHLTLNAASKCNRNTYVQWTERLWAIRTPLRAFKLYEKCGRNMIKSVGECHFDEEMHVLCNLWYFQAGTLILQLKVLLVTGKHQNEKGWWQVDDYGGRYKVKTDLNPSRRDVATWGVI